MQKSRIIVTQNLHKNQSLEAEREMILMIELVGKDIKIAIKSILHMFKR